MRYCQTVLEETAALEEISTQTALDFVDARTQDAAQATQEIAGIFSGYSGEHLYNVYTVWEDTLFSFFLQWNEEVETLQEQANENLEQDWNTLLQCLGGCSDINCQCNCYNTFVNFISIYANDIVKVDSKEILSRQLPQAFQNTSEYENFVLSYTLKNVGHDDSSLLTPLLSISIPGNRGSCATIPALNFFHTPGVIPLNQTGSFFHTWGE